MSICKNLNLNIHNLNILRLHYDPEDLRIRCIDNV